MDDNLLQKLARQRAAGTGVSVPNHFGSADISAAWAELAKAWAKKDQWYIQGFRIDVPNGITQQQLQLSSPGRFLIGLSLTTQAQDALDALDIGFTLDVNNNSIVTDASVAMAVPNYAQGQRILFTPQPLAGNDNIEIQFDNNVGTTFIRVNLFYLPQ